MHEVLRWRTGENVRVYLLAPDDEPIDGRLLLADDTCCVVRGKTLGIDNEPHARDFVVPYTAIHYVIIDVDEPAWHRDSTT